MTIDTEAEAGPYTATQVCYLSGLTYRQLDYWERTAAFVPSLRRATGPGNPPRLYSVRDLRAARVLAHLTPAFPGGLKRLLVQRVVELAYSQPMDDHVYEIQLAPGCTLVVDVDA